MSEKAKKVVEKLLSESDKVDLGNGSWYSFDKNEDMDEGEDGTYVVLFVSRKDAKINTGGTSRSDGRDRAHELIDNVKGYWRLSEESDERNGWTFFFVPAVPEVPDDEDIRDSGDTEAVQGRICTYPGGDLVFVDMVARGDTLEYYYDPASKGLYVWGGNPERGSDGMYMTGIWRLADQIDERPVLTDRMYDGELPKELKNGVQWSDEEEFEDEEDDDS